MSAVNALAWRRGVVLAMELLDQHDCELCGVEDDYRPGRPQFDVVGAYLQRASRDSDTLAAFTSVLSDFLTTTRDGAVPDPTFYERFLEPPAQRPVLTDA